jgi:SAM-dependent methyltransferase
MTHDTEAPPVELDETRAEAFAERMLGVLNDGALAVMLSVGHRTGLLDAMAGGGPATSEALAERAGLSERYVREWLAALFVGGVVERDGDGRFVLPAEHARWLTRAASPDNIAVTAQFVSMLGVVEDDVVACFHEGGGVPYERFPRFHDIMEEDSTQTVVVALEESILPLVDGLVDRLEAGIDVLDVGCGRGRAMRVLAARFPASRFTGMDLSDEAIGYANGAVLRDGIVNAHFVRRDLSDFDATAPVAGYDLVTAFDAVHDQAYPLALVRGVRRALRPGGVFLMQDIAAASAVEQNVDHPVGPLMYAISTMHCMTVSLAQGGEGLGAMWGVERARDLLMRGGFGEVDEHRLEHDIFNAYFVARP